MTEYAKDKQVWLITGANRGIGRAIAAEVLAAGDAVMLATRNLSQVSDIIDNFPDSAAALILDMTDSTQIEAAIPATIQRFGRLDVLVNNAGFGLQGMIEEVSMAQVREQMETNFFGLAHLTQTAIAPMRAQGAGYIVNVSSVAGLRGSAALGIYNASKFAVNGFTEALALEVADFGIRVSIVEPGPYRTDWSGTSLRRSAAMKEEKADSAYASANKKYKDFFDEKSGNQPGDPRQIGKVLLQASRAEKPPLHMVFGDVAIHVWQNHLENLKNPKFMSFYPHDKENL